jgi:hypothetical protein
MFPLDLMNRSGVDLDEKVFLFIANNHGITTKNLVSEMKQFQRNDKDDKFENKIKNVLKDLQKKNVIYHQQTRGWDMEVTSHWFSASNEEAAEYYKSIERKYGVRSDEE